MMTPFRRPSRVPSRIGAPYRPTSHSRRPRWAGPSLMPPDRSNRSRSSCVSSVKSMPLRVSPWTSTIRAARSGGLFRVGAERSDRDGIDRDLLGQRGDRDQQAAVLAFAVIMFAVPLHAGKDQALGCNADDVL